VSARPPALGRLVAALVGALALAGTARTVRAAGDEIQVYLDDMAAPGEIGLDVHLNYVLSGRTTPEWPGELPPNHVFQLTPELSLGATRWLELGLYLPTAASGEGAYGNGVKVRVKLVSPRDRGARFFWGVNVELGRVARRVSEEAWTVELRPILGFRSARWLAAFNPILGFPIRSDTLARGEIEPAVKVGREVRRGLMLGLEYYAALGALDGLLPRSQQEHVPFAVVDYEGHGLALNIGIGRGLTAASDQWVAKAIVSFRLRS